MAFHAGIAAGLVGLADDATEMFGRILDSPAPPGSMLHLAAERMAGLLPERLRLQTEVISIMARQRNALPLPPLNASPF